MEDNKNVEMGDEAMEKAVGGTAKIPGPMCEPGEYVEIRVWTEDGIAAKAEAIIDERRYGEAGWEYLVRYEFEQNTVERWLQEGDILNKLRG